MKAPCILYIDEIDSIAGVRMQGSSNAAADNNQTVNTLLTEMDGFKSSKSDVFVLAATNRLETLDHAITRPGRFDRKIQVGIPDVAGRSKIFSVHLKKLKTKDDKDELEVFSS